MSDDPRTTAGELAEALRQALGDGLRSVILHGSVARGDAIASVSDINVMVLLDDAGPGRLQAAAPHARRWMKAGNSAPLLLTTSEWERAADAFAIEMSDMLEAHEVLAGEDPLTGRSVDPQDLRLQAERELRGKLLQLRTGVMVSADSGTDVGRLLLTALPSFVTYLRAALRLAEGRAPLRTPEVIEQGCALVGADPAALKRCWESRRDRRALKAGLHDAVVAGYFTTAEETAAYVDAFTGETTR